MPGHFPLIHSYGHDTEDSRLGYKSLPISAFPRFLGQYGELSRPLNFREIKNPTELARYLEFERAFWALHLRLSQRGFWRVRHGGDLVRIRGDSRRFIDLWRSSRREFRPRRRFLEIYYEEHEVRLIQNWDLSDWAFFRDVGAKAEVEKIVRQVGLFVPD